MKNDVVENIRKIITIAESMAAFYAMQSRTQQQFEKQFLVVEELKQIIKDLADAKAANPAAVADEVVGLIAFTEGCIRSFEEDYQAFQGTLLQN
jgi:hypothetical protein